MDLLSGERIGFSPDGPADVGRQATAVLTEKTKVPTRRQEGADHGLLNQAGPKQFVVLHLPEAIVHGVGDLTQLDPHLGVRLRRAREQFRVRIK